ncbi:MAG: glutamine synthetase, partial [Muribaculaceae bacterium]|nr:glutamine synthetase [Muribaculaceae bacterium]
YELLAALAVAARYGFELDDALQIADATYVDVNIHSAENASRLAALDSLPVDCAQSADCLESVRGIFERAGVFSPGMIDGILARLRSYDPAEAHAALADDALMQKLVTRYFHCG